MWARIFEQLIGLWLIASYFLFAKTSPEDWIIGTLVFVIASLCYVEKIGKLHLLQIGPVLWLLYLGYSYPTPWLPFSMQNDILVAFLLLMFCIIPSKASAPPKPWRVFLERMQKHKQ